MMNDYLLMAFLGSVSMLCGCNTFAEGSQELVRYDGPLGRAEGGWQFVKSEAGKTVLVPFEGLLESKGGRIQSPVIKLDKPPGEPACYRLQFKAKTGAQCYWWVDLFDADGKPLPDINSAVYPGSGQDAYDQMIYVQGPAASLQLAFQSQAGVVVRDMVVARVPLDAAAQWGDRVYAELQPLAFAPPPDSFRLLPRTAAALKNGTPWNVVMLGDSIVNDSFNSVFQALIQRDFPKSRVRFIPSVRGSTGCWFYQDPTNFTDYVTRHKPDLLMIGGISNLLKDPANVPAGMAKVEAVINQAKQLGCEIVLMSPACSIDWRPGSPTPPSWNENTLADGRLTWSPYGALAGKCGIAFWNMTVPTADYMAKSGKPHNFFNRDFIHNNDRGKQIIGRVLQRYFLTARTPP